MPFTAPDCQRRVRDSFAAQTFMSIIGANIDALEPGLCELAPDYDRRLAQQHSFIHGGVVSTLVDTSSGYVALSLMPAQAQVLTTEFKINLLSLARSNGLVARALVSLMALLPPRA